MCSCSVIVPVLNEAADLEHKLKFIRHWCADAELIVVDGGSSDDSGQIARKHADITRVSRRGRAAQMNAGAALAGSDYLLFLHSDTHPEFALDELRKHLSNAAQYRTAQWGFLRVRLSGAALAFRVIEWAMNWRSRLTKIGTGDQALFISKALFTAQKGFADIALMEDVELCKRLRALGPPVLPELQVLTSSRRWQEWGVVKTVLLMWRLRLLYWLGVHPDKLACSYRSSARRQPLLMVQFAREPVPGCVKTRMLSQLSEEQAAQLHSNMVLHTADNLCCAALAPVELQVAGSPDAPLFQQCRGLGVARVSQQCDGDLGAKMAAAIEQGLSAFAAVIIVGSDAPGIDHGYLQRAKASLGRADVVLGPALDGGYVLIGMHQPNAAVFKGIEWGSERVLEQTLAAIERCGLSLETLPALPDIDRPEDLRHLPDHLHPTVIARP